MPSNSYMYLQKTIVYTTFITYLMAIEIRGVCSHANNYQLKLLMLH